MSRDEPAFARMQKELRKRFHQELLSVMLYFLLLVNVISSTITRKCLYIHIYIPDKLAALHEVERDNRSVCFSMYLCVRKISNRKEQSLTGSSIRHNRLNAATCRLK